MSAYRFAWAAVGVFGICCVGCGETGGGETGPTEGFVCGTDGKTYSVEDADTEDRDVRHRGRCDEPMHCVYPEDCFVGDDCSPGGDGWWCVPGPTRCNCPGVFEPVCGGDHRNYINACEAACAGVAVRYDGYCDEPPGEGCVRAGCSDHLCVEEGMDIASTCEWRPVYECYQQASCERQPNGQCGFTPTHELVECLERHGEGMCRVDPRWQDGFEAECESPRVAGIVGIVRVKPFEMMRLGEWFEAGYQLLEPPVFDDVFPGEGLLFCEGDATRLQGFVPMSPLGELEFNCRILRETNPGECLDDSDCPPGHYCERDPRPEPWPLDGMAPDIEPPPPPGVCVDLCALIDCAPGYVCERGECIPVDCPVDTHIRNFEGECVPKCYGPEQCGEGQRCNAAEVCRPDPACPECDVCVGWCVPSDECRPTGCNGEICASEDVASPCVALPEHACYQELGICEVQPWGQCGWTNTPELDQCLSQFDCRSKGCGEGDYCTFCWFSWECIPEGAVC